LGSPSAGLGLTEDENRRLIGRVSAALNPGGRIVLWRTYRFADAVGWLTDAGFGTPKRINLRSAPGASLATATKPRGG
jgi:hypothetical protein